MKNNKRFSIAAIILAAGRGKRIGQPKWKLRYHDRTFLDIILSKLQECRCVAISCVAAAEAVAEMDDIVKEAKVSAIITTNPNPDDGMLSSIYYGLKSLPGYDGYLIFPVDHPFVQIKTIQLLIDAFIKNFVKDNNIIVAPCYKEHFGHPIIVAKTITKMLTPKFFKLRFSDFLHQQNYQRLQVLVEDGGVLQNINNVQDLLES